MLKMAQRFTDLARTGQWPRTIEVKSDGFASAVTVYVKKKGPNGIVMIPSYKLKSAEALGLSVRSIR